jgi:uncharacterized protein DUF488
MKFFTVGYGGHEPQKFVELLKRHGVISLCDVRLRPDRASMGSYQLARTPEKGIQRLLGEQGIRYVHLQELGNIFVGLDDWRGRYSRLLQMAGALLVERLIGLHSPICLMCAEKDVAECHRLQIA